MESIEEQLINISSADPTTNSWTNIAIAKKAVKAWILSRGESWANSKHNNKTRLQLGYKDASCSFKIRVARKSNGLFGVISYSPHYCPPSTHTDFRARNSS